jgi:hypothetical protein
VLEVRRSLRSPYENLTVALCNGAIVLVVWFILPPAFTGMLGNPHGPDSLAITLLVWMVADVPATNVFGGDATRMRRALDHERSLTFMLRAKALALWSLAVIVCVPIDVISGLSAGRSPDQALAISCAIALIPLSVLPITAVVSAISPYHPIALRRRFAHDATDKRQLIRWAVLVTLPYVLVPALGQVVVFLMTSLEHLVHANVRTATSNLALGGLIVSMATLTVVLMQVSTTAIVRLIRST